MTQYPVFFDPDGKRRRRLRAIALGLLVVLVGLVGLFFFSFFSNPLLPKVTTAQFKRNDLKAYIAPERRFRDNRASLRWYQKWHRDAAKRMRVVHSKLSGETQFSAFLRPLQKPGFEF